MKYIVRFLTCAFRPVAVLSRLSFRFLIWLLAQSAVLVWHLDPGKCKGFSRGWGGQEMNYVSDVLTVIGTMTVVAILDVLSPALEAAWIGLGILGVILVVRHHVFSSPWESTSGR